MISKEDILFPHSEIRNVQDELIKEVLTSIENKQHLIAHAPTGLGKTAASVPIALSYALKNNKTVFFLTSRHTQHKIVIDTLKQIKKEYNISLIATDIIGKKWMCIQPGIEILYSGEFADYCKKLKEDNKCDFYKNTKKNNKLTNKAQEVYEELKKSSPSHTEELIRICEQEKICPYELAALLTKESKVIVADYNHVFDPAIKDSFFLRAGKEIEDSIIIVDEAHNLPKRARENLTIRLTNVILKRAIKEAAKYGF
ncbi:MAG: DEAD/DEAH box helicase family protein [Nanoarchaeota archaeon]